MNLKIATAAAAVFLMLGTAAPAHADVTLTPFLGTLFSGTLTNNKVAYGVSLAGMGKGILGAEFDFSWSPHFVQATTLQNAVTEANMTGNLIVGIPIGGTHGASFRPYVLGGGGLLRSSQKKSDFFEPVKANDFVWDFGGGAIGTFNTHFGVRGDLRYFRSNSASNEYKFWRASAGLAFKF